MKKKKNPFLDEIPECYFPEEEKKMVRISSAVEHFYRDKLADLLTSEYEEWAIYSC